MIHVRVGSNASSTSKGMPPLSFLAKQAGANIQRIRTSQSIHKQTLCYMTGISRPMLDRIEQGTADMRLSYLERIADALSVDAADLLDESGA